MAKLNKMKKISILLVLIYNITAYSQGNCLIFPKESGERKACELSYKAIEYSQGSKESQLIFDKAISVGPKYAWAYYEKSVPYFKRGFLYEGLQILNKAIELEPVEYLCYRASWYWQYKNYDLCIQDLERYYALPNAYMQFTPGGEMNMRIILALAYAKKKNYEKAIETIVNYMNLPEFKKFIGFSDYHVLGLLYVLNKQYDKAIEVFKKQFTVINTIADTYYYLGLAYQGKEDTKEATLQFNKALELFSDEYRHRINIGFSVNKSDVKKKLKNKDGK